MIGKLRSFTLIALSAVAYSQLALGQVVPTTTLEIEIENYVNYFNDVTDYSKLATDPNMTTLAAQPRNFAQSIAIADIVAVNGKPVKGVMTERRTMLNHALNPTPGQAIADAARNIWHERIFEILQPDGTPIGTIMTSGPGGGTPPPGAPSAIVGAEFVVVGGTGAFLGVRGQAGGTRDPRPGERAASMTEDPAQRRIHGGGQRRFVIQLIPLSRPEVAQTLSGPVVVHTNDWSLVTATKPARSGEILALIATGLGPTRPGVEPGQPFPASPVAVANSPVEVIVNGSAAEVLFAGGFPNTADTYQVNFRFPAGIPAGLARLQITAAWIAGPEVRISVQQ